MAPHLRRHLPDRLGHRRGRRRGLSQPAASQQLASLERRVGQPLFARTAQGVEPTRRGRELHAEVADSLDQLEQVLVGLDAGRVPAMDPRPAVRLVGRVLLGRGGTPAAARRPGPGGEIRNRSREPGPASTAANWTWP